MIVGLLALIAAVLAGLNWTAVGGKIDREPEAEQVEAKQQQASAKSEKEGEESSALQDKLQKRCEKLVAKQVEDDTAEEDIEDACACAAEEIHSEFEEELPEILKSGNADPETEKRVDEIVEECVKSAGLELK
jgi:hypothetical protein